jgi:hypothetical protein
VADWYFIVPTEIIEGFWAEMTMKISREKLLYEAEVKEFWAEMGFLP